MAFILDDRVRETSTTTGTGPITTSGAPGGYQTFNSVLSLGDTTWYAFIHPGNAWETGIATYTGTNTLARTTVISSSNSGAAVNFGAGSKDVIITQPGKKANAQNNSFPPGTLMLFQQSVAPIYWTKQTTHNDKALRVVSGAASSGGTNAFSTVMAQTVVGSHQLTTAEIPSHSHGLPSLANGSGGSPFAAGPGFSLAIGLSTTATGGDGVHDHTITMAIQYVDLIIASKDA